MAHYCGAQDPGHIQDICALSPWPSFCLSCLCSKGCHWAWWWQLSELLVSSCPSRRLCPRVVWSCLFTLQVCSAINTSLCELMFHLVHKKFALSPLSKFLFLLVKPGVSHLGRSTRLLYFCFWIYIDPFLWESSHCFIRKRKLLFEKNKSSAFKEASARSCYFLNKNL